MKSISHFLSAVICIVAGSAFAADTAADGTVSLDADKSIFVRLRVVEKPPVVREVTSPFPGAVPLPPTATETYCYDIVVREGSKESVLETVEYFTLKGHGLGSGIEPRFSLLAGAAEGSQISYVYKSEGEVILAHAKHGGSGHFQKSDQVSLGRRTGPWTAEFKKENGIITRLQFSTRGAETKVFEKNKTGEFVPKAN